jgi:ribosomal-protein-alanine N-acetyltransferase
MAGGNKAWPAEFSAGAVALRPPRLRDGPTWSEIRVRNEAWLERWEPTSPLSWADRHRSTAWPSMCSALRKAGRAGTMFPFVVTYGGRFAGQVNVSNVVYGALRSATIGYWIDEQLAGRGITPTAVALVVDHCLYQAGLHRIEIDIRPENAASLRVVEKLRLRREGYHERYLDIDHGWRDHVAFAVTTEDLGGTTLLSRLGSVPTPPG